MIRAESLTRLYGNLTAVDHISFEIGQGEIVGLLGHNGAGKTTIMKMLTGFLEPTSGHVEIDGLDLRAHRAEIQQRIGYLPENCPVYPEMTVIDYLDYTASLHKVLPAECHEMIREAIIRTELEPRAADLIGTLSRGYRQRVGVAQAILHRPTILILDEPTNGLDPTQIQHMRDLITSLAATATVILSTHILQEVQAVCDRVLIIRDGRMALDARLDELRAGSRLLLTTDAEPTHVTPVLTALDAVQSVETLPADGRHHRYALAVDGNDEAFDCAPTVAQTIIEKGFQLYSLTPEIRDLETIFGEISPHEMR